MRVRLISAAGLSLFLSACGSSSPSVDSDAGSDDNSQDASASCSGACTLGTKACEGTGTKVCQAGSDGCPAWSSVTACPSGQFCDVGACTSNCSNDCTAGTKTCDTGGTKTCQQGANGCLHWSAITPCASNEACNQGVCTCFNACTAGALMCQGNAVQTCAKQANGCLGWGAAVACAAGQVCSGGVCSGSCTNQCTEGVKACDNNGTKTCAKQASGCTDWSATSPCGTGQICDQGVCKKNCVDDCSAGTSLCDPAGVRACTLQASGCYDWSAPVACPGFQICSGGACVASCTDQCTAGQTACSQDNVVTCTKLSSGCTEWVSPTACGAGTTCSGGACVATCANQCTSGTSRCAADGKVQSCLQLSSGCTDWIMPAPCTAGQTCPNSGDHCIATPCKLGDARCDPTLASAVDTCDATGNWIVTEDCPQSCQAGVCTAQTSCSAGAVRCNGNNVEICNSAGTAWLYAQTCNVGCASGVCTDPCKSGDLRCNAKTVETCNASGTGWIAGTPCTTDCYQGACILSDLLIDGTTQTLDGDQVFQNSIVIKNGGQLKVGSSGKLKLRAATVSVDAASSIVATGVGTNTQGEPGTACCVGYYYCTQGCCTAGGAAYGVSSVTSCSARDSCGYTCTASGGGSAYGTDTQTDIDMGSEDSTGAKAGGAVTIVAASIELDGQIVANGTGNASGGGVLLAADSLTVKGPVQATGGGTGGKGRAKLLYGSTYAMTGTVDATEGTSVMPPLTIVSGSHPDPTRWYNDGLGDWFIAWDKPFPTLNGYYYVASTNASDVPSPSHGTFLQQESFVVQAKNLTQGANYFHLASVDASANVGTIENALEVQINTVPPAVASSSHPSQGTWYQNNALYVSWTNPQDDANFTGYYYVLDHFADTVPGASGGTFTTNKQLLLSNLADGAWVFHLVNRDTRNATTLAAAHFEAFVGAEPAKGNLSGSVFDGSNSNAPLAGVTIKVNRGLWSQSTTASGTYTFNSNLYVGNWEIVASKDGYASQTVSVSITAGQTTSQNFTLAKSP